MANSYLRLLAVAHEMWGTGKSVGGSALFQASRRCSEASIALVSLSIYKLPPCMHGGQREKCQRGTRKKPK